MRIQSLSWFKSHIGAQMDVSSRTCAGAQNAGASPADGSMCLGSAKVSTVAFQAANVEFKSHPKCQKPGSARMI